MIEGGRGERARSVYTQKWKLERKDDEREERARNYGGKFMK